MFVRAMRDDRTIICATQQFVPCILDDKDFLNPYPEEIKDIYNITDSRTPILFLLSAGADPSTNIENLARKKGKKDRFNIYGRRCFRNSIECCRWM